MIVASFPHSAMATSENLTPGEYFAPAGSEWTVVDPQSGQRAGLSFVEGADNKVEVIGPFEGHLESSVRPEDGNAKKILVETGLRIKVTLVGESKEYVIPKDNLGNVELHQ